jgi:hypothetical protein
VSAPLQHNAHRQSHARGLCFLHTEREIYMILQRVLLLH